MPKQSAIIVGLFAALATALSLIGLGIAHRTPSLYLQLNDPALMRQHNKKEMIRNGI